MIKNKVYSRFICLSIYIFTFYISFKLLPNDIINIWLLVTTWHIYATLIIYLFSCLLKNSSLYDPFWSVAPVPIVVFLALNFNNSLELKLLVLIPIILWAIRLTHNWLMSWDGFMHEDFRYINLKNTNKIQAELNNLFGIHLVPTLLVNLSLFPVSFVLINEIDVNIYLYLSSIFTFIAVILETISDKQMRDFKKNSSNKGKTMKYGLWKYSRHPNYLGESLFWFGIYFMGLSTGIMPLWTILCPTTMLFLFIFISCPMMDQRSLINRSDYRDYMDNTSQLFLWPPKK